MVSQTLAALSVLPLALALPSKHLPRQNLDQTCTDVKVFLARGSDEPYPGRQQAIVDAVCADLPSCGYIDVEYTGTFDDYCNSVESGITNGKAQLTEYAAACPDSKLVLTGYSQGAQVFGDILGGTEGGCAAAPEGQAPGSVTPSSGLDPATSPGNQIAAVVFFGDVRHVADQPYNVASGAAANGIDPRTETELAALNQYADLIQSWCNVEDPACALGNDINFHLTYFDEFSADAGEFILSKL